MAISAVAIIAMPVNAQSTNLTAKATITTTNNSVGEESSNTFTTQNTGTANSGFRKHNCTVWSDWLPHIRNIAITQQPASQNWNITLSRRRSLHLAFRLR